MITIDFLGHATIVLNINGSNVIFDPHLNKDFKNHLFSYYPERVIDHKALPLFDAIILSHSHIDHFDPTSLKALNPETPIFIPNDFKITTCLEILNYKDVISIHDWTLIMPMEGLKMLWTPSLIKLPEFGVAFSYEGLTVWNLVDSVIELDWVDVVLDKLKIDHIDILLLPCQPLLETELIEGIGLFDRWNNLDYLNQIALRSKARYVIPFADGHFLKGRASWLNHHKFPLSQYQINHLFDDKHLLYHANTGDRIQINSTREIQKTQSPFIKEINYQIDRRFLPGKSIQPICSAPYLHLNLINGVSKFLDHLKSFVNTDNSELGFLSQHQPCTYEFNLIGINQEVVKNFCFSLINGRIEFPSKLESKVVELVIAASDFIDLIEGDIDLMSLIQAGMLRERRTRFFSTDFFLLNDSLDIPENRNTYLSSLYIFNLILSKYPFVIAREVNKQLLPKNLTGIASNDTTARDQLTQEKVISVKSDALNKYYSFLAEELLATAKLRSHFIYSNLNEKILFLSLMDNFEIQTISQATSGKIFLFNLIEGNPQFGILYGSNLELYYQRLVENILRSSVEFWEIITTFPFDLTISGWSLPHLIPICPDRLEQDLRNRGWQGEIMLNRESYFYSEHQKKWWAGMPDLSQESECFIYLRFKIEDEEFYGLITQNYSCHFPGINYDLLNFRLVLQSLEDNILKYLMEGTFRLSWLSKPTKIKKSDNISDYYNLIRIVLLNTLSTLSTKNENSHIEILKWNWFHKI